MSKLWWILLIVLGILILIFACYGCDPEGNTRPTQQAYQITSESNGVDKCWFQYVDFFGNRIVQPGLRMEAALPGGGWRYKPNGLGGYDSYWTEGIWIESTGVTCLDGFVCAYGKRDWLSFPGNLHNTQAYFRKPRDEFCVVGMTYATWSPSIEAASADSCRTMPPWARDKVTSTTNNLTHEEEELLNEPNPELPAFGIDFTLNLVQQNGGINEGYATPVENGFMACNLENTYDVFFHSFPFQYSYTVKTADPVRLSDRYFTAFVETDYFPKKTDVGLWCAAENEPNTVHIMRTDYFLPTDSISYQILTNDGNDIILPVYDRWTACEGVIMSDPNTWDNTELDIYDPNFICDNLYNPDRIKLCHIIQIGDENDEMTIKFEINSFLLPDAADAWLTTNRNLDFNNDGFVNWEDLLYYMN